MSMTPEELSRLRELCEKATPGPWEAHVATRFKGIEQERGVIGPNGENVICWVVDEFEQSTENDEFIAAARTALPQLLDEVDQLREVLDSAVHFIESSMVIAKRSCRDGDHLHYAWGERICREARALGPLNALEALEQKARSARSTLKGEVND